jgi:putative transposase
MPSRNILKEYIPHSYYHIYNRGVDNRIIFEDHLDYEVFLNLLKRYLSPSSEPDAYGRDRVTFYGEIELLAFCLMPNYFHLLIYVNENPRTMTELIRRVCTSYTMYFNKKYKREGSLFQGRYKASIINSDEHLLHISRYVHRNPEDYYNWEYSSYPYYIKGWHADWVRPDRIYALYEWGTYERFVNDWNDEAQQQIEDKLANSKLK